MRLKLYRAPTMAEAMARVRAELGPDALILATRRVAEGVEVTAALEPKPPPAAPDPERERLLAYHDVPTDLAPPWGMARSTRRSPPSCPSPRSRSAASAAPSCSPAHPVPARR